MIKNATFVSVFDDGREISSHCKVNAETKEIFDIEVVKVDFIVFCYDEYIKIDEKEYSVYDIEDSLFLGKEREYKHDEI